MSPTFDSSKINEIFNKYHQKVSHDQVKDIYIGCGRNINKCKKEVEEIIASMNQKTSQSPPRRERTLSWRSGPYEATRKALQAEITADYDVKKQLVEQDPIRKEVQLRIDEKVECWNETFSDGRSYDFHWMSPNGAAKYAMRIIDRAIEHNEDKENTGHFRKALKLITGVGRHSENGISTIKQALFAKIQTHTRRWQYTAYVPENNAGVVMVYFE